MLRFGAAVAVLSLGTVSGMAEDELTVTFISHAAVHITDGTRTVLVDFPYDPGAEFTPWPAEAFPKGPKALCMITHGHRDHFAPERAGHFCERVLGSKDVVAAAAIAFIPLSPMVRWKGITITAISTPHGATEHYSYLLEWHGVRLYFSGDAQSPEALSAARKLDAAFVTPGLLIALSRAGGHIDASRIISYHHRPADPVPGFQDRVVSQPSQRWTLRSTSDK